MSIVTIIRDYVEFINNFYDSVSGDLSLFQIIQQTFSYVLQTVLSFFTYVLTFQWFRDFFDRPLIIPQIYRAVLLDNFVSGSTFQTSFSFFGKNSFLLGFFNSFFLSLPISCSHLIIFRRLLFQDIPSGIAAAFGSIVGQIFFLGTILFGIRVFFLPWLYLDSIQYLIGLFLILTTVYSMQFEKSSHSQLSLKSFNFGEFLNEIFQNQKFFLVLGKIFFINFALAWTEQSCIFQYLGNVTFSPEPTILETLAGKDTIEFFFTHINYLFGTLLGCSFFYFLFCFFAYKFTFILLPRIFSSSAVFEKINFILLTAIIGLSLTSIPFYGLDYLLTKPLGFASQDKVLEKTIFYPEHIYNPFAHFPFQGQENTPAVDVIPLDRARYLESFNNTFEDLNYQGEYAWMTREERRPYLTSPKDFFLKRFVNWLSLKKSQKQPSFVKEEDRQKSMNFSKTSSSLLEEIEQDETGQLDDYFFGKAGETFSNFAEINEPSSSLEMKIKKNYYSTPVYKNLLNTDIDFFLSRQPTSHLLTLEDEKELFEKRLILADYYDSLRVYNHLPYLEEKFQGSKSYADRIYNQQFKGTLNIVRRLFSITPNADFIEDEESKIIPSIKYDQPLYTNPEEKKKSMIFFHEEIPFSNEFSRKPLSSYLPKENESPFLEKTESKPFYAGWDKDQRKFIITNRFLPRSLSGYQYKHVINQKNSQTKTIQFTAWPLSPNLVENKTKNSVTNIPYTFLFQGEKKIINQDLENMGENFNASFLPTNISGEEQKRFLNFDNVAPKRGGFVWPGGDNLKINFSQARK